jgi:tyrosinase
MSHIVITGAQGGETKGAVAPNRLEINDLIKPENHDMFSLYIQALSKPLFRLYLTSNQHIDLQTAAMFDASQSDPVSHFGIGGIHGLPYARWEGSGDTNPVPGSQLGGYCTHGTVLFPTWHRPYVALYEVNVASRCLA